MICLRFFVTVSTIGFVYTDLFTSVSRLKLLPSVEQKLIKFCDSLLRNIDTGPHLIHFRRFLDYARKQNDIAVSDEKYMENPINGFHLLWRLVQRWQAAISNSSYDDASIAQNIKDFLKKVSDSIKGVSLWPTRADVSGSATALARLRHTYDLDIEDIIKGRLLDIETAPLEGEELFAIADEIHELGCYGDAATWWNKSISVLEGQNQPELLNEAYERLVDIVTKMAETDGSEDDSKYLSNPDDVRVFRQGSNYHRGSNGSSEEDQTPNPAKLQYYTTYQKLCRQNLKTPDELAELSCTHWDTNILYLKAKVEYVNINPPIVLFHDVISDDEIEWIKNTSRNLLTRSLLGKSDGSGQEGRKERISQSAWMFDDLPVTLRLSRRIQTLTGLSTVLRRVDTHAEALQVLNYGLGGMYEPHEDSVRLYRKLGYEKSKTVRNSGDRMATWLFYMSDVQAGGATVFPLVRARVPATKGSAAFWFNLKRNGVPDLRTIHAGCPVLVGDKWVANKWIREIGQIFRRRCSTDPNE